MLNHQKGDSAGSTTATTDADNPTTTAIAVASTVAELEEFHNNLIIVLEGLSQNAAVLLSQHDIVLSHLMPALLGQLTAEDGDVRLVCLRAFIDIITHYITQPELYEAPLGPPSSPSSNLAKLSINHADGDASRNFTKKVNDLIEKLLLPRYADILNDADPIPIFGLKLLNIILERNPTFIATVNRLNLTQKFFDFFQLDNPNNNITNIKLIKKLVESPDIDKKILFQNGIVGKLTSILMYSYENNVDQFFEPLLDIVYLLLRYTYNYSQRASHTPEHFQNLHQAIRGLGHIPIVTMIGNLLSSSAELDHAPIVERCSRIAYLTYKLFNTPQVKDAILTSLSDEAILACFTDESSGGCGRYAAEPLLKFFLLAASPPSTPSTPPGTGYMFDKHVVRLKGIEGLGARIKQLCINSKENAAVSKLASEVWKLYFS